jgi:NADH dehydrogenase
MMSRPQILIVGCGYVGVYAARRLQAKLRRHEADITVADPRSYMTYQPLLSDVAAGSVEPRHVVVPLRQILPGSRVITASVTSVDTSRQNATVAISDDHHETLGYDYLVVCPGSVSKVLPVPGLAAEAIGFTTLGEAIYLRNHVLSQLDKASSTDDARLRDRLLSFVFVGGGYAGVEALGQLEEMARFAIKRYYGNLAGHHMRWILVEAADRIMPEVSRTLAEYAVEVLRARGITIALETTTESVEGGMIELSEGTRVDAGTLVWTTGISPHPMLDGTDLPRDEQGRVRCLPTLQVADQPNVFAAGDCASVPDLAADDPDATCAPSAQHATRQGRHIATNIVAALRNEPQRDYTHRFAGSVAAIGRRQGVAEIYGKRLRGWPAWAAHRSYHLAQMPTVNRRARIAADWALDLVFPRQVVALGELHEPAAEFAEQARATEGT